MHRLWAPSLCCFVFAGTVALTSTAQDAGVGQHEQKAQEYLRARQPELARKEFEIVAKADPGNLDAQANLGVLLYFAQQYQEAEPHLRAAIELDPKQSKLRALLGLCERRNGEREAARKDLAAALPEIQDPKIRKQAGLELVELDTASGDLPGASAAINELKASASSDPEILYAAYRVYTDLAGEAMLGLSLAAPESAQMHQAMAHELIRERDNNAAITNLRAALKADPNLPGAHFELAETLAASSDPALKAEAGQQYEIALRQNPGDEKTLTKLGDLAADKGDHPTAIADYKRALALQTGDPDASIGLAHELVESGHPDEALVLLEQVVKNDPSNTLAHYRLSAVYRRLHRPEDSKREVAEYERLKALREKLRGIYEALRMNAPQTNDAKE